MLYDEVEEFSLLDINLFLDAVLGVFMDLLVGEGEVENFLLVVKVVDVDGEGSTEFAVDLNHECGSVGDEVFIIPGGPFVVGV